MIFPVIIPPAPIPPPALSHFRILNLQDCMLRHPNLPPRIRKRLERLQRALDGHDVTAKEAL